MSEIILSNGMITKVEEQDLLFLNQWNWHARQGLKTWYAWAHSNRVGQSHLQLGRVIIEQRGIILGKLVVDHKDGNGLNNLHSNLRIATVSQNAANTGLAITNNSGYKGVSWCKSRNKWRAYISDGDRTINLGSYDKAISAAVAYNHQAKMLFGEFAYLNQL